MSTLAVRRAVRFPRRAGVQDSDGLLDRLDLRKIVLVFLGGHAELAGDLFLLHLGLHRDDLATHRREVLVASRHRRRTTAQEGLNDEIHNLDFAFREAVADPHVQFSTIAFPGRQRVTCNVRSQNVGSRRGMAMYILDIAKLFGGSWMIRF